jgi:cobalt-zinc-cadmium efflux system protein
LNERGAYLHLLEDVLGLGNGARGCRHHPLHRMGGDRSPAEHRHQHLHRRERLRTLRKGTGILMQEIPAGLDMTAVRGKLLAIPHVIDLHDQHTWTLDGQYTVLTVHLRTPASDAAERAALIRTARQRLKDLGVHHATIELEAPGEACELEHH